MRDSESEPYMDRAMRTLSPPEQYKPPPMDLFHALCGIMTESGELMDAVKRFCFYGKELDTVNLKEEVGDLFWYMALLCQYLGCSFEDIQATNIRKLAKRYPEKFTADKALNRDLDTERTALESPRGEITDECPPWLEASMFWAAEVGKI